MAVCFLLNRKLMLNSSSMEGSCLASHIKPKLCRFIMVPWAKPRALLMTHRPCPAVPLLHVLCALPGLRWDRSDGRVLTSSHQLHHGMKPRAAHTAGAASPQGPSCTHCLQLPHTA